jgi:hypothetical protein
VVQLLLDCEKAGINTFQPFMIRPDCPVTSSGFLEREVKAARRVCDPASDRSVRGLPEMLFAVIMGLCATAPAQMHRPKRVFMVTDMEGVGGIF